MITNCTYMCPDSPAVRLTVTGKMWLMQVLCNCNGICEQWWPRPACIHVFVLCDHNLYCLPFHRQCMYMSVCQCDCDWKWGLWGFATSAERPIPTCIFHILWCLIRVCTINLDSLHKKPTQFVIWQTVWTRRSLVFRFSRPVERVRK